ncbi:MAG: helix-turn-helix domain-containing protein [Prevotella sp.]|jgi:transcriptional regulator with XRE-family HTH domain|nr:helix-turn-helix domain-containing protein [Prevotella sp.]
MKTIYDTLLKLRKKKGKTQAELAEYLSLDSSSYGKLERGETDITLTKLEQLAQYYNMSVVDLISYPDKYINVKQVINAEIEEKVSLTIELKKEKKEQVLKLVFGENNLEILNK